LYFFEILVEKMKHKKPVLGYSLLVIFCWSLTVFTYHAFQIFTPIMAIYLFFSHRQLFLNYFRQFKKSFFINLIFLFLWIGLFIFSGFEQANAIKFSGLSIFSNNHYNEEMFQDRQQFAKPNSLWAKLYSNDLSVITQQLTTNIFKVFSADFLFIKGGNNLSHNVSLVPNLYPFEALLIILALIFFIQEKKPWQKLVFFMTITAVIAPVITFEANHSTRAFPLLLPLSIMAAYGLRKIYLKRALLLPALFLLVYALYYFVINYFIIAPRLDLDSSNWYMKQLTASVWQEKNQYDFVVFNEVGTTPYIYFLYYLKYQPALLSYNLTYYPPDQEGFRYAKSLENIYFINDPVYFQNFLQEKPADFLYVSRVGGDSLHVTDKYSYQIIAEVTDEKSTIVYQLMQVNRQDL